MITVINCGRKVKVSSQEEASKLIRETIGERLICSEKWYSYRQNGSMYDNRGNYIGYISYNGRIWPDFFPVAK